MIEINFPLRRMLRFLQLFLVLCGLSGQVAFSQEAHPLLREKIFVQTDRNFYVAGNILWFSLFDVDGIYNRPLDLSKVAYLELLDGNNKPVLQAKIALKNGRGNGSLELPFSLLSGNYILRAYTAWMKNFPPQDWFSRVVTIVNTTRAGQVTHTRGMDTGNIIFNPEGGTLVRGLPARVAFRITGAPSRRARGILIDGGDTLARFRTLKGGIGDFRFIPPDTGSYEVEVTRSDGLQYIRYLPAASADGVVMQVMDTPGNFLLVRAMDNDLIQRSLSLVILDHGRVQLTMKKEIREGMTVFRVDKSALPAGLSLMEICDAAGKPLCRRSYFNMPDKKLVIHGAADKPAYGTRKKVTVNWETAGVTGKAIPADCAISVYRLDSLPTTPHTDLYSYLWLYSRLGLPAAGNLNGQFDSGSLRYFDDLVLTSGSAHQPEPLLTSGLTEAPEYHGHIITGRVTDIRTGKPAGGVLTYLSVPGRRIQMFGSLSNDSGMVHFDLRDFYGSGEIVTETNLKAESRMRVQIFSPFSDRLPNQPPPVLNLSSSLAPALEARSLSMQVEKAYHSQQRDILEQPVIDSLPFYGTPDKTYLLDDYTRYTTMEEVLREYVSEVNVQEVHRKFHLPVLDETSFIVQDAIITQKMFADDPLILLDGVPIFSVDRLMAVDPLKVKKLDIVTDRYTWGPINAEGILSFTTYKGDLGGFKLDPGALVMDYAGLALTRKFYAPVYPDPESRLSPEPDYRNLLFWSPSRKTDKNGKGHFSFYTSDLTGEYLVVIQGISSRGLMGRMQFSFAVENPSSSNN